MQDGRIVSASLDTHLRVWSLETMRCTLVIEVIVKYFVHQLRRCTQIQAHLSGTTCLARVSDSVVASGAFAWKLVACIIILVYAGR